MIECINCHTLNPDAERVCLVCGGALPAKGPTGASALATAHCPAGHPVNPAWTSCPYCDRGTTRLEGASPSPAASPRSTRLESAGAGETAGIAERPRTRLEPAAAWPPAPAAGRATRLDEPAPGAVRRTVLHESSAGAPATHLVAALAAPGFGPGGTVFPIRAGRNTIGTDRSNEIVIAGDPEVSREHAVLLYRNGAFHLSDHQSTNGTRVNGREVPADGAVELHDRDHVCCGTTDLVLLVIDAAAAQSSIQASP